MHKCKRQYYGTGKQHTHLHSCHTYIVWMKHPLISTTGNKNIGKQFHIVELSFEFIIQSFININGKNQYLLI